MNCCRLQRWGRGGGGGPPRSGPSNKGSQENCCLRPTWTAPLEGVAEGGAGAGTTMTIPCLGPQSGSSLGLSSTTTQRRRPVGLIGTMRPRHQLQPSGVLIGMQQQQQISRGHSLAAGVRGATTAAATTTKAAEMRVAAGTDGTMEGSKGASGAGMASPARLLASPTGVATRAGGTTEMKRARPGWRLTCGAKGTMPRRGRGVTGGRAVWRQRRRQQATSRLAARLPCTCPNLGRSRSPSLPCLHCPRAPSRTCAPSWSARRRRLRPGSTTQLRAAAAAVASGGPNSLLPVMRRQRLYLGPDPDPDPPEDPMIPDPEADPWISLAGIVGLGRVLTAGGSRGPGLDPDLAGLAGRVLAAGGARSPLLKAATVSITMAPVMAAAASSTSGPSRLPPQPQPVAVAAAEAVAVEWMMTIWSLATAAAAPFATPAPTRRQQPLLPGGLRRYLDPEPGTAPPLVRSAQQLPPGSPHLCLLPLLLHPLSPPLPSLPCSPRARPVVRAPPRPTLHHYHMYRHHILYRPHVSYRPHGPPVSPTLETWLFRVAMGPL